MQKQSWIIGSDSSCDIVVDNPTVSGRHCRLESDGTTLTLVDLESTNGTFVNGERVTGSHAVTTNDEVRLGQHESMPWPESIRPATAARPAKSAVQTITIGRVADNDVVLNESNVSSHHARLVVTGEEIVLEDLGSTNGTSVGTAENKINRTTVQLSDTLFFGSAAYAVSDLLAQAGTDTPMPATGSKTDSGSRPTTIAVGMGIVALVLVGWMVVPDRGADDDPGQDSDGIAGTSGVEETSGAGGETSGDQVLPIAPEEVTPEQSLFAVVRTVKEIPMRVGTAFAIDSHHVATAADVARQIQEAEEDGERAYLYSPHSGEEISFSATRMHPEYESAVLTAQQAQREYNVLYDRLEADFEANSPTEEAIESARQQLVAATVKAQEATERVADYLVAIIEVETPLEHWLPANTSVTGMRPNLRVTVMGLAPDMGDYYLDTTLPIEVSTMESRVRQLLPASSNPERLLVDGLPVQREYDYQGSPVINAQGEVVAIYARATPPQPYGEEPQTTETFDAPLFERINECLAQ